MSNDRSPRAFVLRSQTFPFLLAILFAHAAIAELVPFTSKRWIVQAEKHEIVMFEGREALYLENGQAWIDDLQITDGEIEFDIAFSSERGFSGATWRMTDPDNFEEFYLRHHQSGNPDANQYTPIFNGSAAWQLYHGETYAAPVRYRFNEFMHVKIRYSGSQAEVYIDSDEPVLEVLELKHEVNAGKVGISSTFAPAYFSNFSIQPLAPEQFDSSPVAEAIELEGRISQWLVSPPFSQADLDGILTLDTTTLNYCNWQLLDAEASGITNLAEVAELSNGRDTVFARAVVESPSTQLVHFKFGYSDNAKLFFNGKPVYEGNNTYRSRDYRYLGTIGLFDSVYLQLRPGANEILFAIQENFGGWGVMAQISDSSALEQRTSAIWKESCAARTKKLKSELEAAVAHRVSNDGFTGSVLVSRNGEILLHETYGLSSQVPGEKKQAYWIASTSKQFTGAAVALLANEGKLDVDAKIGSYLEEVPTDKQTITIRQLLTHTSGLGQAYASEGILDREAAARAILQTQLIAAPGEEYNYSNDGFSLLAILVEKAAGQSFEDFLSINLLDPVGMANTGFWGFDESNSVAPLQNPQLALNQTDTIYSNGHSQANWGYRGATGMYSTAADLHAWITRLITLDSNSSNPLSQLISPQHFIRDVEGIGSVYYGFGIAVVLRDGSLESISHNGDDDWLGHSSAVAAYTDGDVIIVLSNHGYMDDGTSWSTEVARDIRKLLRKD